MCSCTETSLARLADRGSNFYFNTQVRRDNLGHFVAPVAGNGVRPGSGCMSAPILHLRSGRDVQASASIRDF